MPLILIVFVIVFFGAQPTIKIEPIDDDCRHVKITRFFGMQVIVDATQCGDEKLVVDGKAY